VIALPHGDGRTGTSPRNVWLRIGSALVLAPLVLAAAYAGGWIFLVLCAAGGLGIYWEWTRLVTGAADPSLLAAGGAALLAALVLVGFDASVLAVTVVVAGAALAGVIGAAGPAGRAGRGAGLWAAAGVLYAGSAFLGPALLRRDTDLGFRAFLFLAATVWMTDVCAYAVGRTIGGPLLWPRLSPNKTWSGAVGGAAGGVAGGLLVAYAGGTDGSVVVGVIALLLSVLSQAGDLLESAVKRRFGAKDTSQLIPGHGGLMDRLDGFLVAALAALLIGVLRQGTAAPAHGLLLW